MIGNVCCVWLVMIQVLRLVSWFYPTMPIPGEKIAGETFDRAFGDVTVGPTARADPLITQDSPPRISNGVGLISAMDLVEKEAVAKIPTSKVRIAVAMITHVFGGEPVEFLCRVWSS